MVRLAPEEGLPAPPSGQPTWTWPSGTWKVKASLKYGAAALFLADIFLVSHFLRLRASCSFTWGSGWAEGWGRRGPDGQTQGPLYPHGGGRPALT